MACSDKRGFTFDTHDMKSCSLYDSIQFLVALLSLFKVFSPLDTYPDLKVL
jgi:hypothetical protein